ncbi:unnamed protein product [Orchesella dallaii]|uniref:Uncharacterized protein n=1 Tax=Orchesella dallaii TaxID=48710 RepID=A0ABP1QUG6_9HEXA
MHMKIVIDPGMLSIWDEKFSSSTSSSPSSSTLSSISLVVFLWFSCFATLDYYSSQRVSHRIISKVSGRSGSCIFSYCRHSLKLNTKSKGKSNYNHTISRQILCHPFLQRENFGSENCYCVESRDGILYEFLRAIFFTKNHRNCHGAHVEKVKWNITITDDSNIATYANSSSCPISRRPRNFTDDDGCPKHYDDIRSSGIAINNNMVTSTMSYHQKYYFH